MSFVIKQSIGDQTLTGFYKKVETEGDSTRFSGVIPGSQVIIDIHDGNLVEAESTTTRLVTLPFSYLVGGNQLMVLAARVVSLPQGITGFVVVPQSDIETGIATAPTVTYEEVDSVTVRIIFSTAADISFSNNFMFIIPHTATPSSARERIVVKDQGDNVSMELEGYGDGVLMRSPNGVKWLLRVDDSGNLVTESR